MSSVTLTSLIWKESRTTRVERTVALSTTCKGTFVLEKMVADGAVRSSSASTHRRERPALRWRQGGSPSHSRSFSQGAKVMVTRSKQDPVFRTQPVVKGPQAAFLSCRQRHTP